MSNTFAFAPAHQSAVPDPSSYTITFADDGTFNAKADCNTVNGTYTTDGDKWATNVDVAWNPEWVGTRQVRDFRIEGDRLVVTTPWRVMPNWADKGMTRSIVTFERAK